MIPVHQTVFTDPANPQQQGNCLQAAVASLLELQLDEVPHFVQVDVDTDGATNWWTYLCAWLRERGWLLDTRAEPGELCLAAGLSPRGIQHVVLYRGDDLVHDPHPDGTGLLAVRTRWALRACEPIPMRDKYREERTWSSGRRSSTSSA